MVYSTIVCPVCQEKALHFSAVQLCVHTGAAVRHSRGHVDVVLMGHLDAQLAFPSLLGELLCDIGFLLRDGGQLDGQLAVQDVGHQLFTDSVAAECALGIKTPNKVEIDRALEKVDLLAYKERHPLSLSGGQMQRLAVVVSEICGKELLVFDEPTSGLDLKSMEEIGTLTRSLATQGKVLLIITHDIEFMMRICTRILFIRDGEIVEDLSGGQKEKIVRLLRGEE